MKSQVYRVAALDLNRVEALLIRALLIGAGIGAVVAVVITTIIFKIVYDGQTRKYESELSVKMTCLTNLSQEYDHYVLSTEDRIEEAVSVYKEREVEYENEIDLLYAEIENRDTKISELTNTQETEFTQMKQFWYVFKNAPTDSGLTLDHLRFSIEQGEKWNVDPQLMWALYDVESDFNPKADSSKSTARGLGQVLESTAKAIWENTLGHGSGSYKHSMAYDPYVNIEISTCIMGRNLAQGTLEDAIWLYGDRTDSYYGKVIQAAQSHGYALNDRNARYS